MLPQLLARVVDRDVRDQPLGPGPVWRCQPSGLRTASRTLRLGSRAIRSNSGCTSWVDRQQPVAERQALALEQPRKQFADLSWERRTLPFHSVRVSAGSAAAR